MTKVFSNEPIKFETGQMKLKVELRPFVPPRMNQETRAVFLRYGKIDTKKFLKGRKGKADDDIDMDDVADFKDGIPAEIINEINDITIKRMVVEIDGKKGEDAFEFIMNEIPQEDYDQILDECNKISKDTDLDEAKKKD